jgi:hypothetical protein
MKNQERQTNLTYAVEVNYGLERRAICVRWLVPEEFLEWKACSTVCKFLFLSRSEANVFSST